MPQKTFTADEILKLKAASAKAHNGRVLVIDLDDPIATTIAVAPFSRAEYADYYDAIKRDEHTAMHGALLAQLLYPGPVEIEALRQDWPVITMEVCAQLAEEAGFTAEMVVVRKLAADTLPAGLTFDAAEKLVDQAKGRKLWSVEMPGEGLSCVMVSSPADVWLAAQTAHSDAAAARRGLIAALENYVVGSVVWPAREALTGGAGILDRKPRLFWDLWSAYKRTGGDGTAVRRKSV